MTWSSCKRSDYEFACNGELTLRHSLSYCRWYWYMSGSVIVLTVTIASVKYLMMVALSKLMR